MARRDGQTKAEWLAEEVAKAVGAGKPANVETVDFSDPDRPKTCLEVDFPILPINQIAAIEGNAGKPIYQMSKWWARRRSSVFRAMLIAAGMKAPEDPAEAAKAVWDVYYANHQKKGAFKGIKVADVFMGGGTTVIEGSRLGMQMYGVDLNPVAWLIVKNALSDVTKEEVEALLADIEAEVKPQIMPFYACDGPNGERGKWLKVDTGEVMGDDFDPFTVPPEQRKEYCYEGPEIIYTFWAKHGPCQVTGCGHRTPIMTSPVMAVKTLTVKYWGHKCPKCKERYDIEDKGARMAPDVPLVVAESERPFATLREDLSVTCPLCDSEENFVDLPGKGKRRKVELSLLVHPEWLAGESKTDRNGNEYGGSATDSPEATARWNKARARKMRLVEVRGPLPDEVTCPETGVTFQTSTAGGTVPKKSHYACAACGTVQDILKTVKASKKTGPMAAYAVQGYSPSLARSSSAYAGRFLASIDETRAFDAAHEEWEKRKNTDLAGYWPQSELPYGFMTHMNNGGIPNHGYTHWWTMFNPRQLLFHALFLKAVTLADENRHSQGAREIVLGGWQQMLRYHCMFSIWQASYDKMIPHFSSNNYYPKSAPVEGNAFAPMGAGTMKTLKSWLSDALQWRADPWELVSNGQLSAVEEEITSCLTGKSERTLTKDANLRDDDCVKCCSATDIGFIESASLDLAVTDPPFGGLLHYSELSDFFYVWLRLALREQYPSEFSPEYTPKTLEVVANRAREPEDPDGFYRRLLTESWREAYRTLKLGGMLAFTFHHSEDAPWVDVLESLFDADFYLEATYPIRSDETKGQGSKPGTFGSQKIEYDIIHVCRKRREEPQWISWAKLRRQVVKEVRHLQALLEHHAKEGLPEADLQVIRRGKALEYYSRHYGKVYIDEDTPIGVAEALAGINQLLEEETGQVTDPPPVTAEPFTRLFLRLFQESTELARDQIQKFLRGTGIAPSEYEAREWCKQEKKVYYVVSPLEIAREWHGKHRRRLVHDYDQAAVLVGACYEGSGINATETLNNPNFKPHPALGDLLQWLASKAPDSDTRTAAARAENLYRTWKVTHEQEVKQLDLFLAEE